MAGTRVAEENAAPRLLRGGGKACAGALAGAASRPSPRRSLLLSVHLAYASLRNPCSISSPALTTTVEDLSVMKFNVFAVSAVWLLLMVPLVTARARVCANGLCRAGSAGRRGAVTVRKR